MLLLVKNRVTWRKENATRNESRRIKVNYKARTIGALLTVTSRQELSVTWPKETLLFVRGPVSFLMVPLFLVKVPLSFVKVPLSSVKEATLSVKGTIVCQRGTVVCQGGMISG